MLLLISLLLLQNIWSVTAPAASVARDTKCIYKAPNGHLPPLVFDARDELMTSTFVVPDKTEIRLACPGTDNYLKETDEGSRTNLKELEFKCNFGTWLLLTSNSFTNPHLWFCDKQPKGHFAKRGECNSLSDQVSFYAQTENGRHVRLVELFHVCRTKDNPRTIHASHKVAVNEMPPEGASIQQPTIPVEAYSGYTGDPSGFKRYQQIAMVTKYGMEIVKPYFGNPELDLFLTPTWVVPFDDFPHLDGLQDKHNFFLLYAPVLQHLKKIREAIRKLSVKTQERVRVVTITSQDNEKFEKVKLFTPETLVILTKQGDACLALVISNGPYLNPKRGCKTSCSSLGWPALLDPTKGLVECCSPEEVKNIDHEDYGCAKDKPLHGPL